MNIIKLTLGEIQENCYIVEAPSKTALVIDPGAEGEIVESELERNGLALRKILLTHGHFDHMGAAAYLKEKTAAQVYIGRQDEDMLSDTQKSGAYLAPHIHFHAVEADARVGDGDEISQGSMKIKVFATPGHSAGSVCYIIEDCIFAGDTVFKGSVGRTDLYSGDAGQQWKILKKLSGLKGDYKLYCGHGEDTTLDEEKKSNPYLRQFADSENQ